MAKNSLVFELSNGGKLKLADEVVNTIHSFLQVEPQIPEAGGMLMGRFLKNTKDIVVDKITVPMKGDKQSRYTFKRLSPLHQRALDKAWQESKGTCNYLGEWHTHPETNPIPSDIDKKDWKRKLSQDSFSSRFLYFLIAGTETIHLWEADRRTLTIQKRKRIQNERDHHCS